MKNRILTSALIVLISLATWKTYAQLTKWKSTDKAVFTAITKNGNTGYIKKSTDGGYTWTTVWDGEMNAKTGQNRMFGITSGNGTIVAVGNVIITSKDGGNSWTEIEMKGYNGGNIFANLSSMKSVVYGNGFFVAAGPFHILYSKDGLKWEYLRTGELSQAEKDAAKKPSGLSLEDIAKDPKLHGKRPSIGIFPPEIQPGLKFPRHLLFAGNKFFLTGGFNSMEGKILKIEGDKIVLEKELPFTGNAAKLNTGGLQRMAYDGKSTIYATSISDKSAYSTDMGETWQYLYNPGKNQIWAVTNFKGLWISASPFEDIFTSTDLQNFETIKRGGGRSPIQDMIVADDRLLLFGTDNMVFASTDGKKWELISQKEFGMKIQAATFYK